MCLTCPLSAIYFPRKVLICIDYLQPSKGLLDEIRYTNQLMVETMVDLDPTEDTATYEAGEGTTVRCTYRAVAFDGNLKMVSL